MGQDYSVIAETVTTTAGGVTIGSGGTLAIKSGQIGINTPANSTIAEVIAITASGNRGLVIFGATGQTASLLALQNSSFVDKFTVDTSGGVVASGSIAVGAPGTASVSVATASGTTVPIAQGIVRVSGTAATTSGSCTLAAGSLDGQQVLIINESANNFVVTGNMKANQTVAASSAAAFVWVSTDTAWWRLN